MSAEQRSPEEIREDIAQTREELADTAAALAYKADVKARAKDRVEEIKSDVTGKVTQLKEKSPDSATQATSGAAAAVKAKPLPYAAVAAALLGFTLGYLIAHRSSD